MLEIKTYVCVKCGKKFTKSVGGVVMTPREMELMLHPVCSKCKLKAAASIFK